MSPTSKVHYRLQLSLNQAAAAEPLTSRYLAPSAMVSPEANFRTAPSTDPANLRAGLGG
jgi:hypothetical protein